MKKVSSKITSAIVLCCMVVSILIGSVSIFAGYQQITKQAKDNLQLLAENEANKFSRTIEKLESTARNIVMSIEATADVTELETDMEYITEYMNEIDPIIRKSARSVDGNISAYVVFDPKLTGKLSQVVYALTPEGNFAKLSDEMLEANASREDFVTPGNPMTQWFHNAVGNKEGVWSDPQFNPIAKMDLITYSKPIYINDKFIGVVAMDIDFNILRNLTSNITAFESGYGFLLNNRFDSLYHPTIQEPHNLAEIENGALKSITEYMEQHLSGVRQYTLNGEKKMMGYAHLANGSILGIVVPNNEILAQTQNLASIIIILTGIFIVLAIIIGFIIARSIAKPITHLKELMKRAEEGDLTVVAPVKSKDEIGQLSQSFNYMLEEQRNVIHKVIMAARLVSSNVEKVGNDIHNITTSTQQMGEAANEVASSASSTSETIVDVTSSLEEMDATIELIAQNSYDASKRGKETVHVTEDGKITVNKAASEMDVIKENMLDITSVIEGLGSTTAEIGKIISIIEDIAEQTNLLSLNASIEAARAGEYGRGFSVVAEAIGGLAMKSGEATKDIAKLIKEIQETVYGAIDHTKNSADKIRVGVELVKQTENIFENILDSIKSTTKLIDEIAVSTEEQTKTSKAIMESVTNVNDMSIHVSSAVQEQVATIEEIMNAMERVNVLTQYDHNEQSEEYIQNLTYQAQSLLQLVSKFKVDEEHIKEEK